jgi:integrase
VDWEAAFYGSVLAANCGLRGGEIKKLRISVIDLQHRRLLILRKTTKTDAGARHIELNLDATQAAARLLFRAQSLGATDPEHYLMPKHLGRIMYGPDRASAAMILPNISGTGILLGTALQLPSVAVAVVNCSPQPKIAV